MKFQVLNQDKSDIKLILRLVQCSENISLFDVLSLYDPSLSVVVGSYSKRSPNHGIIFKTLQ